MPLKTTFVIIFQGIFPTKAGSLGRHRWLRTGNSIRLWTAPARISGVFLPAAELPTCLVKRPNAPRRTTMNEKRNAGFQPAQSQQDTSEPFSEEGHRMD